jgi:dihydrodipicolinate synthase/N-acetylneuraminate lyase
LSGHISQFSGLFVATLTPFDTNNRVEFGVIRAHTQFLLEAGVNGISPCGTTGEFLYLSIGEKVRNVEETVTSAIGRVPVMAGIWALTPKETTLLARAAEAAGASAVFLQPPIYYPASDDAIVSWYSSVRQATELPVFAYNIPVYAANSISLECLEKLVGEGIISGIKDSSGTAERMKSLVERFGDKITVMAASDSFAAEARIIGAHGFVSALANVFPDAMVKIWSGDSSPQPAIDAVRSAVKKGGGIPALKYLAGLKGFGFGEARLPGSAVSPDGQAHLDSVLKAAKDTGLS